MLLFAVWTHWKRSLLLQKRCSFSLCSLCPLTVSLASQLPHIQAEIDCSFFFLLILNLFDLPKTIMASVVSLHKSLLFTAITENLIILLFEENKPVFSRDYFFVSGIIFKW